MRILTAAAPAVVVNPSTSRASPLCRAEPTPHEERALAHLADALPKALERYRALVADFENALHRDVDRARAQLRGYLDGGIVRLVPNESDQFLDAEYRFDCRALLKSFTDQGDIGVVVGAAFGLSNRAT